MQRVHVVIAFLVALCAASAARAAPAVMILYFDNDTGDASFDPLGKGLADMMVTDLAALPDVQIVEREKLEALLGELKLQRTKFFDPKTAQKIGNGVGAEFAITGALAARTPELRIDVRVVRIATGQVVKADKVVGKTDKFFELEQELVTRLASGLGAALGHKAQAVKAQGGVDNVSTVIEYGKGLELRDRGDLAAAAEQMEKAMKVAPEFKLARSRYLAIMKDLYAAKGSREDAMKKADASLVASLDARIARDATKLKKDSSFAINWRMTVPAIALRSELMFRRLVDALDRPAAELRPALQAYLDNQQRLLDHQIGLQKPGSYVWGYGLCADTDWRFACLDKDEVSWASDLGLANPMDNSHYIEGHQILQDMHGVIMFAQQPAFSAVKVKRAVCLYKLDPALPAQALKLLDRAIALIAQYSTSAYDPAFLEEETISLHLSRAQHFLLVGKREDAIASVQAVLTKYPKGKRFGELEGLLRAILAGETKGANGRPFVPACADPR